MSIHRIQIISGLAPNPAINEFSCCDQCSDVVLTFQNIHNASLTVTAFTEDTSLGVKNYTWTVLEINGNPPSFPFVVAVNETFTMKLAICYLNDSYPNLIEPYFTTVEHNDDKTFTFNFDCELPIISSTSVDFGSVPPLVPSNQSITITNTTVGTMDYSFAFLGGDCDGLSLPSPSSGTISPGGSVSPTFTWTPTGGGDSLNCIVTLTIGNNFIGGCETNITFEGLAEESGGHSLVLTGGLNETGEGVNNFLCCVGCQYVNVTFQNQSGSTITLTDSVLTYDDFFIYVELITINSTIISYPYTILDNQYIELTLLICSNGFDPPFNFGLQFEITEQPSELAYDFTLVCVDSNDMWSALFLNFGEEVPAGTTASQFLDFTNTSFGYINLTTSGCFGNVIQVPEPLNIAPGQTVTVEFQWTPAFAGLMLSCNLQDNLCGAFIDTYGLSIMPPATNHITIESGLLANEESNGLYCCYGCGTNQTVFKNTHTSTLNVTDFVIDDAGSGVTVSFLSINGAAVSFPYVLAPDETLTIEFEVCWDEVTSPLNAWTGHFVTTQFGDDLDFTFNMNCQTPFWNTETVNFVDAAVGFPNTQTITFFSLGAFFQTFNPTLSGCTGITINTPVVIEGLGDIVPIHITWTPTVEGETLSCTLDDNCGNVINITGNAVAAPCEDCFCLLDLTIKTENNYLPDQSSLNDIGEIYTTASFLEKKTAVFSFIYPAGINSQWRFQFTPALFLPECFTPFDGETVSLPTHYAITYLQSLMPDGTAQNMQLIGGGANAMNIKNWECTFTPQSAVNGTFKIEFTFYHLQDRENWMDNTLYDNLLKYKRSTQSATIDWQNTFPSVYNSDKLLGGAFMVIDPTILDGENFTYCQSLNCANYTARHYNKGLYNGLSEFTNPTFTLSRFSGTVTNFSILERTKVTFTITVPSVYGTSAPVCIYHVFDVTNVDNSVDFLNSSDTSRYRVTNLGGNGILDNHLMRPGTVTNSLQNWTFSLYVNKTVNPNARYRVAAIVYGSNGTMVNTFLSNIFTVTRFPDMNCECYPDIDSTFIQYWQETNTDCFRPVAKERIGHRLVITEGDFKACMNLLGLGDFEWREQLKSVQLNIYKRIEGYPNAAKTTFFQYQTHKSLRNNAFLGGFQNLNQLVVADVGSTQIVCGINDIRVPWEDVPFSGGQVLIANTATYLNRTNAGSASSVAVASNNVVQSWIDETIYFEYIFTYDLRDQVGQPFPWTIVKAFPVSAIDLEPSNSGEESMITDVTIQGLDKISGLYVEIEPPICFSDWDAIKLIYQADREGNFIFFMEKEPFGFNAIVENNELNSLYSMTQLNNPLVLSMDTAYDPVTFQASVVLDAPNFDDAKYRFCGYISEPQAVTSCNYFLKFSKTGGTGATFIPSIQTGGTATVGFNAISYGNLYLAASLGDTQFPIDGNTYVFEWNYTSPTTLVTEIWFGQLNFSGAPDLVIPVGSTSGSYSFVWNNTAGNGWITFRWQTGTPMTNTGVFKLGNELCP